MLTGLKPRLTGGKLRSGPVELHFMQTGTALPKDIQRDNFPIITTQTKKTISGFESEEYFKELNSRVLGNTVLFTDVISSTMPLVNA